MGPDAFLSDPLNPFSVTNMTVAVTETRADGPIGATPPASPRTRMIRR